MVKLVSSLFRSNHMQSPLCGSTPTSDNAENLSQYDLAIELELKGH